MELIFILFNEFLLKKNFNHLLKSNVKELSEKFKFTAELLNKFTKSSCSIHYYPNPNQNK